MGPSYYSAPNGTVAGYSNPAYVQPSSNGYVDAGSTSLNAALGLPSTTAPVSSPDAGQVAGATTSVTSAAAPDPAIAAAAAAKATADANKTRAFQLENEGALGTAAASTDAAGRSYGSSILDYITGARQTQAGINNEGVQAELSKRQGNNSILDYVHNGIQSGGVMLGNKNAGTSSATEALARAYATLGQHQMAGVGTQYALDQNRIGTKQSDFDTANLTQGRHNEEFKTGRIADIVGAANTAITNIRANMAYASLPDQINQQQEIEKIKADATAKLNSYDPSFTSGMAGITPSSLDDRAGAAQGLQNAGTAATNPYQLTTQAPATFQGGSPAGADLPIFTLPRNKVAA